MFLLMSLMLLLCGCDALIKECTGIPYDQHKFKGEMATTNNETWRQEIISMFKLYDESVNPLKFLTGEYPIHEEKLQLSWESLSRKIKNPIFIPPKGFLKEVPLQDVRLHAGTIHGRAQQTNLEYLLMLEPDRLIWNFRKTAGLPTPAAPYGGWENATTDLRGHFVG